MASEHETEGCTIVGVHIPAYKNLREVWIPWSDGLALLGANGAGKSNVLEAIALLLGTEETLHRGRHRLDLRISGASVVVRGDHAHMPLPPGDGTEIRFPDVHPGPWATQILADDEWWTSTTTAAEHHIGKREWAAATVRYLLESVNPSLDRKNGYERVFSRTLLQVGAGEDGAPADSDVVLELPPTSIPPSELTWLPRLRSTDEAEAELRASFEEAVEPVGQLMTRINQGLDVLDQEEGTEAGWVIHEVAARAAREELQITAQTVSVESVGEGDAHWRIQVVGREEVFELGDTGTGPLLERLSAGQQRWADEAFATMSNTIRRFGLRADVFAMATARLTSEQWQQARSSLPDVIASVRRDQYWSFDHFEAVLRRLEPLLLAAATAEPRPDPRTRRILHAMAPQYDVLTPRTSVRVFDEPEAHLHPREQRRIARALDRLRLRGNDVLIASHSPAFLDVSPWRPLQVTDGRVSEVPNLTAPARTAIARDLGATRGDLLAGVSALLVVEGTHDELVLDTCFGPQLRAAGVVSLPMRGTEHLSSVLALDFVHRFMDVPPTIMLDFTDAARVRNGTGRTSEERKLVELIQQARQIGFEFDIIGLREPDIVCYLNAAAVQALFPTFTDWQSILAQFKRLRPRPASKTWLYDEHQVDLRSTHAIADVLTVMIDEGLPPVGQLHQEISALLARLHDEPD